MTSGDGRELEERLLRILDDIVVVPRRLLLDTAAVRATTSLLRGVWGRALRGFDCRAYARVFDGQRVRSSAGTTRLPLYLMRPAPPDPAFAPAVDWILFGAAIEHEDALVRAWDTAAGLGLGPDRAAFSVCAVRWLDCDGQPLVRSQRWSLRTAAETKRRRIAGRGGLRIQFQTPLRLLRRGRLIERPTVKDICVVLTRRILLLAESAQTPLASDLVQEVLVAAEQLPVASWRGERRDFVRWSGSQHCEVEMRGVAGTVELPAGAPGLWPLLAAGCWTHLGKGTVFGLGRMQISRA